MTTILAQRTATLEKKKPVNGSNGGARGAVLFPAATLMVELSLKGTCRPINGFRVEVDAPGTIAVAQSEGRRPRRIWKGVSDAHIVADTKTLMKRNGINSPGRLQDFDGSRYQVLSSRGLLDRLTFTGGNIYARKSITELMTMAESVIRKKRADTPTKFGKVAPEILGAIDRRGLRRALFPDAHKWAHMTRESRVQAAQKRVDFEGIQNKTEFERKHGGLAKALKRNHETWMVKFPKAYFLPKNISDDDLVKYANDYMTRNGIKTRGKLGLLHKKLYERLRTRGLLERIPFEPGRDQTDLQSMNDDEKVAYAKQAIRENHITKRRQFKKLEPGLWTWIGDNRKWGEVGLKEGKREYKWASLTPEERLKEAKWLKEEKGFRTRTEFEQAFGALYGNLVKDGTFDQLGFEERLGKWERMGKEELLEAILARMRQECMWTVKEVSNRAGGMYGAARDKGMTAELREAVKKMRCEAHRKA